MVHLTYQHVDDYFYPLDDEIRTVEVELTSPIHCIHETLEKERQYPPKARSNLKLWKPEGLGLEGLGFPNARRSLPPEDLLGAKRQELLRFHVAVTTGLRLGWNCMYLFKSRALVLMV